MLQDVGEVIRDVRRQLVVLGDANYNAWLLEHATRLSYVCYIAQWHFDCSIFRVKNDSKCSEEHVALFHLDIEPRVSR